MSTIKIALVQKKAIPNNKNGNLELAVQYIKEASCMLSLIHISRQSSDCVFFDSAFRSIRLKNTVRAEYDFSYSALYFLLVLDRFQHILLLQ